MVYLRKKDIYRNDYWYLCRSKRVDGDVKQEVVSYIGSCGSISREKAEEEKEKVQHRLDQEQN